MPKSNLCVIGLTKMFTDDVCKQLSIRVDMFYANIEHVLEYELIDAMKVETVCGKEYLLKEEMSIIKRICTYEDTIINMDFANLNNETNLKNIKDNCLVLYLRLSHDKYGIELSKENQSFTSHQLNMDLYEDRDIICSKVCDVVVDCDNNNIDELIDIIIERIVWYYS